MTRSRLLGWLLFLGASGAGGQAPITTVPIDSGRLVRMHRGSETLSGRLLSRFGPGDSVIRFCRYPVPLCDPEIPTIAPTTIASRDLNRLELQQGSHAGSGFRIGGLFGVITGWLLGSFAQGFCESQECAHSGLVWKTALGNGLLWGGFGALIGSTVPRWEQVR